MIIRGFTQRQRDMADIMWSCRTQEQVNACITLWGAEAIVVRDMIIATSLDEVEETGLAMKVLDKYLK